MFDEDSNPSASRPSANLLDELEAIKGTLERDDMESALSTAVPASRPLNVPLLDDMVIDNLDEYTKLLDIDDIFEEDDAALPEATTFVPPIQFPRFTLDVAISDDDPPSTATPSAPPPSNFDQSLVDFDRLRINPERPRVRPDYSRETLIQEIIDDFIPQIEVELQRRLRQLDDATLRRLLGK